MRRASQVAVLILTAAVAGMAADGKQSPLAERAQFFGNIDVSVFNLEVFVTDRDGNTVSGLGIQDFELLIDGQPTPILNFFAGSRERMGVPAVPMLEGSAVQAQQSESPLPELQRLYVVVFIDNTSIRPSSRNRVIGKLKEILTANVGPNDRVIVVTQGPGLNILHGFADPLAELGAVLDTIAGEAASTGQFESERLSIISELKRAPALAPGGSSSEISQAAFIRDEVIDGARAVLGRIHSYQQWRFDTARQAANDLAGFMDALAGIDGRKALLYVGEGTPFRVAESLYQAWDEKYEQTWYSMADPPSDLAAFSASVESNRRNLQRVFEAVAARAAASRVTFYAIDAGMELATTQTSAEHPGYAGASLHETDRLLHQQQSLQLLAAQSGGHHFTNLENVAAVVEQLAEDFSSYYSLGFAPPGSPDGEDHRIEVRLRRPGLQVRHASGFRDKTLGDLMADRLYSALILEVSDNPLGVSVATVESEKVKRGRFRVRLLAQVPVERLLLVRQADEHLGRISAWVAVANEFGGTSDVHGRRIPVRIPDDDLSLALDRNVGYALDVMVGGGRQRVAVVMRDEISLLTSTVTLELEDGQRADGLSTVADRF